ncbi:hypothetical protein KR026_005970, partial [Drosophila bipectinata]
VAMRSTILLLLSFGFVSVIFGKYTYLIENSRSFEDKLLSRKVRGLIFPDKASVLLTAALTKLIVGGRPSGLQYSLEFDMYHPLPDTVEGWQPKILKRLRPKTTTKPKRRLDSTSYNRSPTLESNENANHHLSFFLLFKILHCSFQIDLKSCIKRAMCELRAKINAGHHEGFLMEDLMRIVLTVPEEIQDGKYKHRKDVKDCALFYAPSCPYNVLNFLTQN